MNKDFETKDFENEYKEYSKLNTPDLWSRIEEGLDKVDSATVSEAAVNEAVVNETVESEVIEGNVIQLSETVTDGNVVRLTKADTDEDTVQLTKTDTDGNTVQLSKTVTDGNAVRLTKADTDGNVVMLTKTVKKKKSITKYAGIIAAAACAVIAIPAIIFISGNKSSHYDSEAASASACEAAEVSYEATADEEAYEASYEEAETSFEAAEESMVNEATADMASEAYYEEEAPAATEAAATAEAASATVAEATTESASATAEATTEEVSAPEKSEYEGTGSAANSVRAEKVAKDENESSKDNDIIPYFEEDFPGTTDSIDFSMAVGDPKTRIILEANCDIKNFKFMKMSVKDVYEDGSISVDTETIIVQKNFNKGELIGIDLTFFGDMPEYAVSYVDDAGVRRFCSLMESGYDGSLVLNEENVK